MDPITMSNKTAVTVPPQQGFLRSLDLTDSKTTARLVCLLLPFPFLLHYLVGLAYFHWTHLRPKDKQVPPTLPHLVPTRQCTALCLCLHQIYQESDVSFTKSTN